MAGEGEEAMSCGGSLCSRPRKRCTCFSLLQHSGNAVAKNAVLAVAFWEEKCRQLEHLVDRMSAGAAKPTTAVIDKSVKKKQPPQN